MIWHHDIRPRALQKRREQPGANVAIKEMCIGTRVPLKEQFEAIFFAVAAVVVTGGAFHMKWPYILVTGVFAATIMPKLKENRRKNQKEKQRFIDVAVYMEQMLYSFRKQKKILVALEDVESLFSEGRMKEVLGEARREILYDFNENIPNQNGLDVIEQEYECQRLKAMHRFMMKVEQIGGSFDESIELLLNDRSLWVERTGDLQKEQENSRRNIMISILLSILICLSTFYFMPKDIDITEFPITSISTMTLLISCMKLFQKADTKLTVDWLKLHYEGRDKAIVSQYQRLVNYNENGEKKKSFCYALLPLLFFCVAAFRGSVPGIIICGCLTIFMAQQYRIGHYLNKKRVTREVEKAFPQWLMEIGLLLQSDNVQVSIQKTYESVPAVLKPELELLLTKLEQNPESQSPYMEFFEVLRLPAIQSSMKMLSSISNGHGGDASQQIKEIIHRNNLLMDKAEKLENEDRTAGTNLYFLLPMLLGSFKLILDLSVFMLAFLKTSY